MSLKKIAGKASYQMVRFIVLLTRIFPIKWVFCLGAFVVFTGTKLNWKRKRIALSNLKIVFPEKTEKQRKAIFRESLRNMLKNYIEITYVANGKYTPEKIAEMAGASGLEYLDELKQKNQGALLYSGHFGNFPLMIIWLAVKGYPVAAVYKEAKNFPEDFFGNIMRRFNVIPLKYKSESALTVAIIRTLKEGKIVLIQNDQSHPDGIYINFFGKDVPSLAGPALLAKRTGVPIIPAYICRDKSDHHNITVLPEITLIHQDDHNKFMLENTQMLLDWIAEILIQHPTEWLWLHNRWKRARETDLYPGT
jgi:KDO2-lipid IV(A) lauroyltransferase